MSDEDLEAELADEVAAMVGEALDSLLEGGCPAMVVLGAAHGALIVRSSRAMGPGETARILEEAAARLRNPAAATLSLMRPAGRA